jgi:hypothetical protein
MFSPNRLCFGFLLSALMSVNSMGADILENFDAYAPDSGIKGQEIWTTWDNSTDPAVNGVVSAEQASSGTQSLKVIQNNDCVGVFGKTLGIWTFSIKAFVPADHAGTTDVILMSAYPYNGNTDYVWGTQIGLVGTSTITDGLGSLPLVTGAWSEVKVSIDIWTNTRTTFYNEAVLSAGTWSNGSPLAVVDLYGEGGSSAVYFDDLAVTETPSGAKSWTTRQCNVGGWYDNYNVGVRGSSAALDGFDNGYVVSGSGGDIWGGNDSFTFAYDQDVMVTGDFDASVQIRSFTKADGTSSPCAWGRAGLMLREYPSSNASYVFAGVNGTMNMLTYSREYAGNDIGPDPCPCFNQSHAAVTLPIWMRIQRTGATYTFYWKQNEADAWTQLYQHVHAFVPGQLMLGFGVQNHGGCQSEAAAIGKFSNLAVTDTGGAVAFDALNPLSVYGITAAATSTGPLFKWNATGDVAKFVAERTVNGVTESMELLGTMREVTDTTAPDGFAVYKLTPYDASNVAGVAAYTGLWTTGMTALGRVSSWTISPHINQSHGSNNNPTMPEMISDYIGGEATALPVPGTAFAGTGCNYGAKAGFSCATPVYLLAQNQDSGQLDFSNIFGDIENVITYMITYVTNNTGAELPIRLVLNTDDSAEILIDNTIWYGFQGCCADLTTYAYLPAGEHRLIMKVFEGTGGHNGWLRILKQDGSPFDIGTITCSPYTTLTSVPAPVVNGFTLDTGFVDDWLIIGQYAQSHSCGPTIAQMALDYLTEGANGPKTEANIVPVEGMMVNTDYAAAESDGCVAGTAAGATCNPVTVLKTSAAIAPSSWGDRGRVNFNNIFGDQDNLMSYLVCYLTNNTDDYQYALLGTGSDDSITVKLDNMIYQSVSMCRGYTANQDSAQIIIPPGTHRLMAKVFEGGSGFDGGVSIRQTNGIPFAPGVLSVSLTPPTGFTVPPAPMCIEGLAATSGEGGVTLSWTNPQAYDAITVERKAVLADAWTVIKADLAGDATSYVDETPDTAAPAVYYRVTPKILDAAVPVCTPVVGVTAPGYAVYQEGIFPTAAYTGTQDTHIIKNTKDSNQGGSPLFEEGDWNAPTGYDHKEALLGFDIAALPAGKKLQSAQIGVFFDSSRNGSYNDHTVYIRQVMKAWNQGTGCCSDGPTALAGEASWNNARSGEEAWEVPGAYGTTDIMAPSPEVSAVFGAASQRWVSFEGDGLKSMIKDWMSGFFPNNGVKITQCQGFACAEADANTYVNGAYDFCSSEHSDVTRRPILILNYNRAPTVSVAPATVDPIALCAASVDVALTATVEDLDGDALTVTWTSTGGTVTPSGDPAVNATVTFTAVGDYTITCTVSDGIFDASKDVAVSVIACPVNYVLGDVNNDQARDISDPVAFLGWKFLGQPAPICQAACDINADGMLDISDAVYDLQFQFLGGPKPKLALPDVSNYPACDNFPGCPAQGWCPNGATKP